MTVYKSRAVLIPIAVFLLVAQFIWQGWFVARWMVGHDAFLGLQGIGFEFIITSAKCIALFGSYHALLGAFVCGAVAAVLAWPFVPSPEDAP